MIELHLYGGVYFHCLNQYSPALILIDLLTNWLLFMVVLLVNKKKEAMIASLPMCKTLSKGSSIVRRVCENVNKGWFLLCSALGNT